MKPKELCERSRFAATCGDALRRIKRDEFPAWLKEWKEDGFVTRELRVADVDAKIEPDVYGLMLGLDVALSEVPPAATSDVKKELKRLTSRINNLRNNLDKVSPEVGIALLGEPEVADDLEAGCFTFEWPEDPLANLQVSLDSFLEAAKAAHFETGRPGARRSYTTLAIVGLVNAVLNQMPHIERPTLTKLTSSLLGPVIERSPNASEPDWDDRVGEAMRWRTSK